MLRIRYLSRVLRTVDKFNQFSLSTLEIEGPYYDSGKVTDWFSAQVYCSDNHMISCWPLPIALPFH